LLQYQKQFINVELSLENKGIEVEIVAKSGLCIRSTSWYGFLASVGFGWKTALGTLGQKGWTLTLAQEQRQ